MTFRDGIHASVVAKGFPPFRDDGPTRPGVRRAVYKDSAIEDHKIAAEDLIARMQSDSTSNPRETYAHTRMHLAEGLGDADELLGRQEDENNRIDNLVNALLDLTVNFAHNGFVDAFFGGDFIEAGIAVLDGAPAEIALVNMNPVDIELAGGAERRREDLIADRRDKAKKSTPVPRKQADAYVKAAVRHTSDTQNTHDPSVVAAMKAIVSRLRGPSSDFVLPLSLFGPRPALPGRGKSPAGKPPERDGEGGAETWVPLEDIATQMLDYSNGPEQTSRALKTLSVAMSETPITSLGATDKECIQLVWNRIKDPKNSDNARLMREAFVQALSDCWEGSPPSLVCVTGRAARILGSLALLDYDERNWNISKLEDFKNEAFVRTRQTVDKVAAEAAKGNDPEIAKAGKAILAKDAAELREIGDPSDRAADALRQRMIKRVHHAIDDYVAEVEGRLGEGIIPWYHLTNIKKEAEAGIP